MTMLFTSVHLLPIAIWVRATGTTIKRPAGRMFKGPTAHLVKAYRLRGRRVGPAGTLTAGRKALFGRREMWRLDRMTPTVSERRSPRSNPCDGSAAGFADRHLSFRQERLRRLWSSCPACGGHSLHFPSGVDRRRVPEADGVCANCGAALKATSDGDVLILIPRHSV